MAGALELEHGERDWARDIWGRAAGRGGRLVYLSACLSACSLLIAVGFPAAACGLLSCAGLPGLPGAPTDRRQHQDMAQVAQERAWEGDHPPRYARRHAAGRPHVRSAELQGCLHDGPDELGAQVGDARDDARQSGVDLCQHQGGAAGSLDGPRACAARAHVKRSIRVRQAG
eukprot:COSAG02_NODE_4017_length_5900_cov_23.573349_2_plen_172_part_00